MHDFLTNTTPSARLWSLRGILTSRSHPSSAEEGSRAHPNVLFNAQRLPLRDGNGTMPRFTVSP
jgi:hypothetical protein